MTTDKNGVFRHGVVLRDSDHQSLMKIQEALISQRGGEVSISDAIRDAIRFRARQLKVSSAKA